MTRNMSVLSKDAAASSASHPKTLDMEHGNAMSRIGDDRRALDTVQASLRDVAAAISEKQARGRHTMSDSELGTLHALCDRRDELACVADDLRRRCDEVGYFVRTAGILFKYYDVL